MDTQNIKKETLFTKTRPNVIPLKTLEEPNLPLYHPIQEDSLSPKIELSPKMTYINIRLGKLSAQTKTRSTEDKLDSENGSKDTKSSVRRSNSARSHLLRKRQNDLLQSPNFEDGHNPQIWENTPKQRIPGIPGGNYGYDGPVRDPRYHKISEESNESGVYTNSEKSTNSFVQRIQENNSDSETIVDPSSLNEIPCLTTPGVYKNAKEFPLEETIRADSVKREEPIYVNIPFSPYISNPQTDSYLSSEVLKLRGVLEKFGNLESLESLYTQLRDKDDRVYQLERMNEKLKRDNEILQSGLSQKTLTVQSQQNEIKCLTENNNKLMTELNNYKYTLPNSQSNRYIPPLRQDISPMNRFISSEDIFMTPQNRVEPMDQYRPTRGDPRRDSAPNLPENAPYYSPLASQSEYPELYKQQQLNNITPLKNFTPCFSQSDSRAMPHSTPNCGNNVPNIPLNAHFSYYPVSHNPDRRNK